MKNAQKFRNVVHPPLITGPDDRLIIGDTFFFPEHHVFTGITRKLFKEIEKNVFKDSEEGKKFMDQWMADPGVNVSRTVWHGSSSFVGNMAELLLSKVQNLVGKMIKYLVNRPQNI